MQINEIKRDNNKLFSYTYEIKSIINFFPIAFFLYLSELDNKIMRFFFVDNFPYFEFFFTLHYINLGHQVISSTLKKEKLFHPRYFLPWHVRCNKN